MYPVFCLVNWNQVVPFEKDCSLIRLPYSPFDPQKLFWFALQLF